MATEQIPHQENNEEKGFDAILQERNAQGWHYLERETLTRTKLDENARFVEVPYQTKEDIQKKWIAEASAKDPKGEYEVELVPDYNQDKLQRFKAIMTPEEYRAILENLQDEDKAYFVFLRKKEQ